jgi:1-phosphofructokinase family hexose kinase
MIHVFSPNTAHEVILGVSHLKAGAVHRATDGHLRIGGKGVNVARACGRMGTPVRLVALADARGAEELAHEPDLAGATVHVVPLVGRARSDVIVAEVGGRATVINGIGDPIPEGRAEEAADRLLAAVQARDIVVLAGSLPRGAPADLYGGIVAGVRARGGRTIVDASGTWLRGVLEAEPEICKVNVQELADALGRQVRECWQRGGALVPAGCALVLSRAMAGARVWSDGRRCAVRVPAQVVVSGVGAGDAMTAGIAVGLAEGAMLVDAVARGAAWGAAAVRELDLTLDPEVARAITAETHVGGCRPA